MPISTMIRIGSSLPTPKRVTRSARIGTLLRLAGSTIMMSSGKIRPTPVISINAAIRLNTIKPANCHRRRNISPWRKWRAIAEILMTASCFDGFIRWGYPDRDGYRDRSSDGAVEHGLAQFPLVAFEFPDMRGAELIGEPIEVGTIHDRLFEHLRCDGKLR